MNSQYGFGGMIAIDLETTDKANDFMVAMQMDMIAKMKHGAINPNYDLNALVDEGTRCWKGYMRKGFKTMFGKRVPNCVKREGKYFVHDAFGEEIFESAIKEDALNFLRQNYLELKKRIIPYYKSQSFMLNTAVSFE